VNRETQPIEQVKLQRDRTQERIASRRGLVSRIGKGEIKAESSPEATLKVNHAKQVVRSSIHRLNRNLFELDQEITAYEIPKSPVPKRVLLLEVLLVHQAEHPDEPIPMTLKELGNSVGVSRQRVKQIHKELNERGYELPQLATKERRAVQKIRDGQVKELVEQGAGFIEIANRLRIGSKKLYDILNQLSKAGEILVVPTYKEERDARREGLYAGVAHLRLKGYTPKQIKEMTGKDQGDTLKNLYEQGKAPRMRRKKRSRGEILTLNSQVKQLRGEGLKDKQIAERLNVSIFWVTQSVWQLLKNGEIKRKKVQSLRHGKITIMH